MRNQEILNFLSEVEDIKLKNNIDSFNDDLLVLINNIKNDEIKDILIETYNHLLYENCVTEYDVCLRIKYLAQDDDNFMEIVNTLKDIKYRDMAYWKDETTGYYSNIENKELQRLKDLLMDDFDYYFKYECEIIDDERIS